MVTQRLRWTGSVVPPWLIFTFNMSLLCLGHGLFCFDSRSNEACPTCLFCSPASSSYEAFVIVFALCSLFYFGRIIFAVLLPPPSNLGLFECPLGGLVSLRMFVYRQKACLPSSWRFPELLFLALGIRFPNIPFLSALSQLIVFGYRLLLQRFEWVRFHNSVGLKTHLPSRNSLFALSPLGLTSRSENDLAKGLKLTCPSCIPTFIFNWCIIGKDMMELVERSLDPASVWLCPLGKWTGARDCRSTVAGLPPLLPTPKTKTRNSPSLRAMSVSLLVYSLVVVQTPNLHRGASVDCCL